MFGNQRELNRAGQSAIITRRAQKRSSTAPIRPGRFSDQVFTRADPPKAPAPRATYQNARADTGRTNTRGNSISPRHACDGAYRPARARFARAKLPHMAAAAHSRLRSPRAVRGHFPASWEFGANVS